MNIKKILIFNLCLFTLVPAQLTSSLSAATQLQFPQNTPGLQTQTVQQNVNGKTTECLHIIIPNTNYSLFFPQDGSQPTTPETGSYSGAQYNLKEHSDNANKITLWYVNQFLNISDIFDDYQNKNTESTSKNPKPLNFSELTSPQDPELKNFIILDQFNHSMKTIASDPIGRTLLYRILIELYRINEQGENCCESYLNIPPSTLQTRNICRNLKIISQQNDNYFNPTGYLCFSSENPRKIGVLQSTNNTHLFIQSYQDENSEHMALFHELLHWFHFLRNPIRNSNYSNPTVLSSNPYNITHLFLPEDFWRKTTYPNTEEILTILGTPQTYPLYINGDDISENAYRASLSQNNPHTFMFSNENRTYHMRWGHTSFPSNLSISSNTQMGDIKLAHDTAIKCYEGTTKTSPNNWDFSAGQAIKNQPNK